MWVDALIAAGGDSEKDAELLAYAGGAPSKAMIQLGGRTFLERIVAAMLESGCVGQIVVVGLPRQYRLGLGPRVAYLPDAGGLVENADAGISYLGSRGEVRERILLSSSDIPLITPETVRSLVELCLPYDVDYCYTIVPEEAMKAAFPGSGRTFVRLADGRFAGGDMGLVKPSVLRVNRGTLNELIGQRKMFWRQVRAIGWDTLALFFLRRLTIERLERHVVKVLDVVGKAVVCPYAEVAMDVDKPHHLDVVRAALARRAHCE